MEGGAVTWQQSDCSGAPLPDRGDAAPSCVERAPLVVGRAVVLVADLMDIRIVVVQAVPCNPPDMHRRGDVEPLQMACLMAFHVLQMETGTGLVCMWSCVWRCVWMCQGRTA